jgi:PAS domain S-box-containing protein
MFSREPSTVARYALVVVVLALATALRFALIPVLGFAVPFILFFPAVVVCAWFGGLRSGILSTAGGGLIAWYVFIPPQYSFRASDPTAPWQLVVFLLAGTLISFLAESLHRARRTVQEGQKREREQRQRLHTTLASIGDAVIVTDAQGRVTFVNHVAEALTGWKQEEAAGQPLGVVFQIVNEESRTPVDNPALRAICEGHISGLANHTILIAKDGTEHPIDDSGAPIRDDQGTILGAILVFRDITERRRSEETLRLAIEGSPVAKLMTDEGGRIALVNAAAERLFGYDRQELLGKPIEMLVPKHIRERHPSHRADFYASPQMRPMGAGRDLTGQRKDGREVPIEIALNPISVRGQRMVLSSVLDISARRRAEIERSELLARERAAREQAETASRAKDEFVAVVSHELRAPLTAIILGTQLLRASGKFDEDPDVMQAFDTVERNAKSQAQLIEDLLDISRVITGKLVLNVRPVEVGHIIETSVDSVRAAADAKSIQLRLHLDRAGSWVSADPSRLQQIVWNLLSNAVKFTPQHGTIDVRADRDAAHAYIVVTDSGEGIHAEFLPYVFDRFSQANLSSGRRHGGLGLGLAIVRHLVELHGGTVRAESDGEGRGATFTVMLPLAATHEASAAAPLLDTAYGVATPTLEGLRVMIVDDAADTRDLLTKILHRHGAEVRSCASASDALEAIGEWRPAVLVSDVAMPEEDGYSLIRRVRALDRDRGGDVPAVALTGYAQTEDRTRALAAGFQMHIPKPVDPRELVTVIASLAGRIGRQT